VFFYWLLMAFIALGLVAGFASRLNRMAPLTIGFAVVLAYSIYVIATGVWAAQCWDCVEQGEDSRGVGFWLGLILYGFVVIVHLTAIGVAWVTASFTKHDVRADERS
jgi:hypothetical protein